MFLDVHLWYLFPKAKERLVNLEEKTHVKNELAS